MQTEMQAPIYFDNSATTPLSEKVKQKMLTAMDCYGNPSSLHGAGVQAGAMLRTAREQILLALGVRDSASASLIFTSCGSEANNLALFGTTHAKERRAANKIVTTDSEHPSIENCLVALEKEGFEIVRIPTRGGQLDMEAVDKALNKQVFLVTMMMVNNETGARYPVEQVFRMAKQRNPEVITHCDAIQGFLKCKFTAQSLGADLISISGHKIHAPKGVGALYVDKKILTRRNLVPTLLGGGQENGLRSGTENTIGIAAFGEAAKCGRESLPSSLPSLAELRRYAVEKLSALEVRLNLPMGEAAPHIVNLTLPYIRSETMLHYLASEGIYVSAGSACSSHSAHPSASLLAFGLNAEEAGYSIRISFSPYNTTEEIDRMAAVLEKGLSTLVRTNRGKAQR